LLLFLLHYLICQASSAADVAFDERRQRNECNALSQRARARRVWPERQ